MSLVLSLTSALFATLLQQRARRYTQTPQVPSLANHHARVRSYLFLGTLNYKMNLAVGTVPTLLLSPSPLNFLVFHRPRDIFLYITVSASVGVFTGIYFALTIFPFFGHDCPYRTPTCTLWWYTWHTSLSFGALCFVGSMQYRLINWSDIREAAVEEHHDRLKKEFGKSVVRGAFVAPVDVDREATS